MKHRLGNARQLLGRHAALEVVRGVHLGRPAGAQGGVDGDKDVQCGRGAGPGPAGHAECVKLGRTMWHGRGGREGGEAVDGVCEAGRD
jgi:hypothetical protein